MFLYSEAMPEMPEMPEISAPELGKDLYKPEIPYYPKKNKQNKKEKQGDSSNI